MIGLLQNSLREWKKRFTGDESFRHLVRASFFSFVIRVIGLGTGFFVTIITSRFYGADALGIVSICIAILSFASVIGKLGMDVALMRYIAEFYSQKNFAAIRHVYLKSFRFIIPVCVVMTVLLFMLSPIIANSFFHKPHLAGLLKINSFFILPLVILLVNSESIRGLHLIRAYTFLQTSAVSILATAFLLIALLFGNGIFIPVYVQFIAITLAAIMSVFMFMKFSGLNQYHGAGAVDSRKLISTSSPMFITTLMQLIMTWGGTLIMASYYPESEVGVYNAIIRISTFTNISILAINSIASPKIVAAFASGKMGDVKKLSREATQLIFISSIVVFLPLFLFPHWVLSVFGKDFVGNEFSLKLLLAGQLFVAFSGLSSQVLNMADREKNLRNNALMAAALNLTACFLLIPYYGISGACIAQVIGMIVWNLLCNFSVKKQFDFFTFYTLRNKG